MFHFIWSLQGRKHKHLRIAFLKSQKPYFCSKILLKRQLLKTGSGYTALCVFQSSSFINWVRFQCNSDAYGAKTLKTNYILHICELPSWKIKNIIFVQRYCYKDKIWKLDTAILHYAPFQSSLFINWLRFSATWCLWSQKTMEINWHLRKSSQPSYGSLKNSKWYSKTFKIL